MTSPYKALPARNFWKTGVAEQHPLTISDLYRKKFAIAEGNTIATAGSCFAQHIAAHLRRNGFTVLDAEPAPPGLSPERAKDYGYGLFSARFGNVYCVRQLLQISREALGRFQPADAVWERDGRFFDAMRPSVEPSGLDSPKAVNLHRVQHLKHLRSVLEAADIFIFTFGLTEAWIHRESGTVYPTAPGTIAGTFNSAIHQFKNFTFSEIYADFLEFRDLMSEINPGVKFIITVSPVPLTATASPEHVLQATTYSKSVLRAVAGQLQAECDDIDYFPSYEIIASPFAKGFFFDANMRSVNIGGVETVMRTFFAEHRPAGEGKLRSTPRQRFRAANGKAMRKNKDNVVCEDALLEAFST